LAAITSARENDFLILLLGDIPNVWIGARGSGSSFQWDGGDPWSFSAFPPSWSAPGSTMCVEMFNNGNWETYICESVPFFVCEADVEL